jgi:hypothetical protein
MLDKLTIDERVFLIEQTLARIQNRGNAGYLGLCVNVTLDDEKEHPHWDAAQVNMAKFHSGHSRLTRTGSGPCFGDDCDHVSHRPPDARTG